MTENEYTDLYIQELPRLVKFIAKILTPKGCRVGQFVDDAEDVAQDVFSQLWRKHETIKDNAAAWIYTAAKHEAVRLKELARKVEPVGDIYWFIRRESAVGACDE